MRPELFFMNLARQRISKTRLNFTANRFVFGWTTREILPRTFSVKLAGRTSDTRLNFTGNTFVFGHKNRENAPKTFFLLAKWKPQKCAQNIFVNFGVG